MNHEDPHQIAAATVEAISHRQYHAVVALLLTLAVWLARAYASRIPGKIGAFLSSGQAGVVLSVAGGQLGAIATALVAGKPFTLDLVLSGLVVSATAGGIFSGAKALKSQPMPDAPAPPPGGPSLRAILPLVALLGLSGCVSAYTTTAASLIVAERTVHAAAEQLKPFDAAKRKAIVEQASSYDAGKAALAEWDVTAERVAQAVEGAHATVKLAADGLKGVRDGLRNPRDLNSWIAPAIRVGVDLLALLNAVGLKLHGVK